MADEFKVEPDDLDVAAGKLRRLADDNTQTDSYLQSWLDLPSSEGGLVLQGVINVIQDALAKLQSNYDRLGRVTGESATEISGAATTYRTTDHRFAESLDKTYVEGGAK